MPRNQTFRRTFRRIRAYCTAVLRRAKLGTMLLQPTHPVPLKFRIAALVVAAVLALSLLELWAGGVRFMKLVASIAQQIAEQEMAKAPQAGPPPEPKAAETPGVVSVGIIPAPAPDKKP